MMTIKPAGFCAVLVFLLTVLSQRAAPLAQSVTTPSVNADDVLYILPMVLNPNPAMLAAEYADLKARFGTGGNYVKVGFSMYVVIEMTDWNVDVNDRAAVRAALAGTIRDIDFAIDTARQVGYPVALNMLTELRGSYDNAQRASEQEDRRNMMWYADNALAPGWWSHSRYARKQLRIQEAYMREVGRILADRMARYPDTLVAASGDGEVELALDRANDDPSLTVYADYSPFAVAEFRDWIRAGGMYAAGQPYAAEAYVNATRYAGDSTPAVDTNGDGHTFNGDFATAFTTWDLKYFDWNLADSETARAIPSTAVFDPNTVSNPTGFDAPRVRGVKPAGYFASTVFDYWKLWLMFRSAMLQRHNIEVAKWMTTSPSVDLGTAGALIGKNRWSSYQIPGDYLFNGSPDNPNGRYESSGSSWMTADVSPYAAAGFTSFNLNFLCDPSQPTGPGGPQNGCGGPFPYFLTLNNLAPVIASRNLRFSLLEWHPSVIAGLGLHPPENPFLFSNELALIERYRPNIVVPYVWTDAEGLNKIQNTGFESMLRQLIADLKDGLPADPRITIDGGASRLLSQPFAITGSAIDLGKVRGSGRDAGVDTVTLRAVPVGGGAPTTFTGVAYGETRSEVSSSFGSQFAPSGFRKTISGLAAGTYDFIASAHSTSTGITTDSAPQRVTITSGGLSVDHTALSFAGTRTSSSSSSFTAITAAQDVQLTQSGTAAAWTATTNQTWVTVSPSTGSGSKTLSIGVDGSKAPASGTNTARVTVSTNDGLTDPVTVDVTFTVSVVTPPSTPPTGPAPLPGSGEPLPAIPIGNVDTPTENSVLSGSIAWTGWALDNIEVKRVELWRDAHSSDPPAAIFRSADGRNGKIFVGNATFVEGARPDIEGLFPNAPRSSRGGWGYIMLTRGLPWEGKGPFQIHAFVVDAEGNIVPLGARTVSIDNSSSLKPFGAIDSPGSGDAVVGFFNNFGWVIPAKGHTISDQNVEVYIDNVFVGNPGGATSRADLTAGFPGFDTSRALRVLTIDSTKFSNGVHTIGWLVRDEAGNADGIGSRFIRINNPALMTAPPSPGSQR